MDEEEVECEMELGTGMFVSCGIEVGVLDVELVVGNGTCDGEMALLDAGGGGMTGGAGLLGRDCPVDSETCGGGCRL